MARTIWLATFIFALVTGCATTPVAPSAAPHVSADKHFAFKQADITTAPVMVIRDSGFMVSACDTRITVNGQLAAQLSPGERVTLHIPAGEVFVGAEARGICAGGLVEQRVMAVAGKPLYYRVSYGSNAEFSLQQTYAR
jgi:hypothetical protein